MEGPSTKCGRRGGATSSDLNLNLFYLPSPTLDARLIDCLDRVWQILGMRAGRQTVSPAKDILCDGQLYWKKRETDGQRVVLVFHFAFYLSI